LTAMRLCRIKNVSRVLAFIAGLAFLNLSFILVELAALDIKSDNPIVKNLTNNGFEEEKEAGGQSSEEDSSVKDDFVSFHSQHLSHLFSLDSKNSGIMSNQPTDQGFKTIHLQPPKI
jgi:hypothetical protein